MHLYTGEGGGNLLGVGGQVDGLRHTRGRVADRRGGRRLRRHQGHAAVWQMPPTTPPSDMKRQ